MTPQLCDLEPYNSGRPIPKSGAGPPRRAEVQPGWTVVFTGVGPRPYGVSSRKLRGFPSFFSYREALMFANLRHLTDQVRLGVNPS